MVRRFCCAKSVACGRVIEREWGNPQRFPPHTPPSLRYARVRTTKPEGNHRKKHHPSGWCFLFGMPRAGLNLLPRPARSALKQEVRQGSCEWLCHSWDAGSELSFVTLFAFAVCEAYKQQNLWTITERNTIRQDGVFFLERAILLRKIGRLRAGDRTRAGNSGAFAPFILTVDRLGWVCYLLTAIHSH